MNLDLIDSNPAAGATLGGELKRIDHPEHLVHVTAGCRWVDDAHLYLLVRSDDVESSVWDLEPFCVLLKGIYHVHISDDCAVGICHDRISHLGPRL